MQLFSVVSSIEKLGMGLGTRLCHASVHGMVHFSGYFVLCYLLYTTLHRLTVVQRMFIWFVHLEVLCDCL